MNKLQFDTGVQEYDVNGRSVLRMNPGDINLFTRFMNSQEQIVQIENDMVAAVQAIPPDTDAATRGAEGLRIMAEADRKVKDLLSEIFGEGNDFDTIFDGVNVMAVAGNGERVITNFFEAIAPLLQGSVEKYAKSKAAAAKTNRAQRRAAAKMA